MAMDNQERLSADLLFEADGHVTEVVLACLADGELDLVTEEAAAHVDACDTCTDRLGAAALRSISAGEALREVGATTALAPAEARPILVARLVAAQSQDVALPTSSRRARRPFPFAAITAALIVAAVAGVPGFLETAATLPSLLRSVPVLVRVVVGILRGAPEGLLAAALLLKWVSAVILIVAGFVVARTMTGKRSLQGGIG